MKKNRITLTDEILSLVSAIKIREADFPSDMIGGRFIAGIESNSVYGGSDLLEDVSMAIGVYDERVVGSEENANGVQFDASLENQMFDMHEFVMKNLITIEHLIHYWSNKGGLKPGTYNTITMEFVE